MRYLSLILLLFLCACTGKQDPLIGRWTVEKVYVGFDEHRSNPEMVRQYGEMEKGNVIEINKDSVLTYISEGDTIRGKCLLKGEKSYRDGDLLFVDGDFQVRYSKGFLQTESLTPWGKMIVTYMNHK